MELQGFCDALAALSLDDIRALSLDIDGMTATPADEVDVARAFLHIEATVRRVRRARVAANAGHRASQVVVLAAARGGAALPDDTVTRVARWAATVARGMVATADTAHDLWVLSHACAHNESLARALSFAAPAASWETPRSTVRPAA